MRVDLSCEADSYQLKNFDEDWTNCLYRYHFDEYICCRCSWMFSLPKYQLRLLIYLTVLSLLFCSFFFVCSLLNNSNTRCLQTNFSDFKYVGAFQMHGECLIKQLDLLFVHNKTIRYWKLVHWKNFNDTHKHAHSVILNEMSNKRDRCKFEKLWRKCGKQLKFTLCALDGPNVFTSVRL